MEFVIRSPLGPCPRVRRAGFTLIELLVAIVVVGIATTIFMQMYTASMNLGKLARNRQVALSVAEGQLDLLAINPGAYQWDTANPNNDGIFRIRQSSEDPRAGLKVEHPKVPPFDDSASKREGNVFDQYRWKAFGKLGERGLYYEIFVDVSWTQAGRDEHIVLTGAVARGQVEPGWAEGGQ